MKKFMDFMRQHYDHYYVVDENGIHIEVNHEVCFAPTYDKRQRWYWDDENHTYAIRLPLTDQGIKIGNTHLAGLKKDERDVIAKLQCVGFGTKQCRMTCADCDRAERCISKQHENSGLKCRRKCEGCPSYISQTKELDRPIESDNGTLFNPCEPASDADPQAELEEEAEIEALMSALKSLTEAQQELIRDIFWNEMTEREIAPLLGVKSSKTINYRKQKILEILRSNEQLKSFFENLQ